MADEDRIRNAEILLVEADRQAAEWMRAAFQELGSSCRLRVLETGGAALAFCRQTTAEPPRPNLVLLDIGLPDTPGLKVLEAFKQDESLRRIPVIVLSGTQDRAEISTAYQLGANSFIAKPADPEGWTRLVQGVEDFWLTVVMLPRD